MQVRWTATTASHCRLLNPEKATFHTLAPILLFIHRYLVPFITRIPFGKSSQALQRMINNEPDSMENVIFQMAPYPGEHFDPAGLPPAGPHPVFPPQCGRCHQLTCNCLDCLIEPCSQVLRRAETTSRHRRTLGSERAELTHLRFQTSLLD